MKVFTAALLLAACVFSGSCGDDGRGGAESDPPAAREQHPTVPAESLKGVIRTRFDSPEPTKRQLERRAKNTARIKEMGLPVMEKLPVIEDEEDIVPRKPGEVAKRCIAVLLCAAKGETGGKDKALVEELVQDYGAATFFSPEEAKFIEAESPEQQELIDFTWRYECAHVLLWALGHVDELQPPNQICNVSEEAKTVRAIDPEEFVSGAKLRSQTEIFDMADYYYRLHWAAIELRLRLVEPEQIHEGIVRERHRALNWLIRYMDQEWDDVATDT